MKDHFKEVIDGIIGPVVERAFGIMYATAISEGYQGSLEDFKKACEERDKLPPTHIVTKDGVEDAVQCRENT